MIGMKLVCMAGLAYTCEGCTNRVIQSRWHRVDDNALSVFEVTARHTSRIL